MVDLGLGFFLRLLPTHFCLNSSRFVFLFFLRCLAHFVLEVHEHGDDDGSVGVSVVEWLMV